MLSTICQQSFSRNPKSILWIMDVGRLWALCVMLIFFIKKGYLQKVKTATLIEPSECCLKRAALHTSVFFPQAEIRTIHKTFDELCEGDIYCDEYTPTLHILSNVLDMLNFDLERLSNLVKQSLKGYNQFVCVGPYFFDSARDKGMDIFLERMEGKENFSETLGQYQLDPDREWTCRVMISSRGELIPHTFSTKVTEADLNEAVRDEYGALYSKDGKRLLKFDNNRDVWFYNIKIRTEIISDYAFEYCSSLQQIIIPDSVTSIGKWAFEGCSSLQQIIISDSVASIGDYAFTGCKSLRQIVIPDSVTPIGDFAFSYCQSLQQIVIPDSVASIGDYAFTGCKSLQQIVIPDSVTSIGNCAFEWCASLQQILIPVKCANKYKEMLDEELWDKLVEQ